MMKSIIFAAAILVFLGIGFQESALSLIRVSVGTVVLAITGIVGVIFASYVKQVYYKKNRPPVAGPVFLQLLNFDKIFDYLTDHAKKNITFRMIAPTHSEIYTADPVVVEYILKTNFPNYEKGPRNIRIFYDLLGEGIFAVDGDKWRHQRKLASHEFSTRVLRDFSTVVFRKNSAKLVSHISETATGKEVINLQDLFMKSTLDSIFKVGFGFDLDTLSGSDESSNRFMKAFDDSNNLVFWRYADLIWRIKRRFNVGSEASLRQNIVVIDNFVYDLIHRKREMMNSGKLDVRWDRGKEDILSRFLAESKTDPENMTDKYLRDITLSFVIAGKDTSAGTLTWFFYMLCKHPLIQEKVAREVRAATQTESNLTDEFHEKLTEAALDKMHYLHAALTETLRLYPAVPVDGRAACEDDILPDGLEVKKGDGVTYMAYAMGRMPSIWGEDAEEFRPERWLDNGVFKPESPFIFTAFQAGPRICLGKEFAYRQMKILAAALLYYFKFRLANENEEATYRVMMTLHMSQGLHLYAIPRK